MHYTIYKITNIINGKIYIGKHQTSNLNDGYMGSGKHLKRSIEKYGVPNFQKEILFVFETEQEMNSKEAEMVTSEFVSRNDTYNLCEGGNGGFSYVNNNNLNSYENKANLDRQKLSQLALPKLKEKQNNPEWKKARNQNITNGLKKYISENGPIWVGKSHSDETKSKIGAANAISQLGNKNSQFGSMWITNGKENKKIKKDVGIIPDGWYKGRATN